MSSPREGDVLAIEDLSLVCSADGRAWWQRRKKAKTHTNTLTDRVKPLTGDLLIEPVDDVTLAYLTKRFDDDVMLSQPYYLDTTQETHGVDKRRMIMRHTTGNHFREL